MKIRLISGYKYTTSTVVKFGEIKDLEKIAKCKNKNLKKQNRIDRYVVYPVSGPIGGMGQLCILR